MARILGNPLQRFHGSESAGSAFVQARILRAYAPCAAPCRPLSQIMTAAKSRSTRRARGVTVKVRLRLSRYLRPCHGPSVALKSSGDTLSRNSLNFSTSSSRSAPPESSSSSSGMIKPASASTASST
ncbi:Uncharacterised protein [Mycobacteroides abscessus subsp. abscessus]|nr:Uncharacterised protein [Mycobacteroides abscessus subsp. abscessus]